MTLPYDRRYSSINRIAPGNLNLRQAILVDPNCAREFEKPGGADSHKQAFRAQHRSDELTHGSVGSPRMRR